MPQTPTPLRYPGGKTSIWKMMSGIIVQSGLKGCNYVEPYAGGCGLALSLLFRGYVENLYLNDVDRSIYCFWKAVIDDTNRLVEAIENVPITIDEWHKQRNIQENKDSASDFDLAVSSLFLNRTNRSGVILKAGVIGGLSQSGEYKLDCRFNKQGLIKKIKEIGVLKDRIKFYNHDALDFIGLMDGELSENSFFYIDPPYFSKGQTLYTNSYQPSDHAEIACEINGLSRSWVMTYDNVEEIQRLYPDRRKYVFDLNYSAANKRRGTELLILGDAVSMPSSLNLAKVHNK